MIKVNDRGKHNTASSKAVLNFKFYKFSSSSKYQNACMHVFCMYCLLNEKENKWFTLESICFCKYNN